MGRLGAILLVPVLLFPRTCTVGLGGGTPDSPGEVKLGVPYVTQQNNYACGPASILMWALYDGRTNVTQAQIAQYVGCSTTSGTLLSRLVPGVQAFTDATDAVLEQAGSSSIFYARQIASIAAHDPALCVVNAGTHTGILDGGHWHSTDSGLNVWAYVYFHDPQVGPDQKFDAAIWTGLVNYHVVSASAAATGQEGLATYGPSVRLRGSDGSISGPILKEER